MPKSKPEPKLPTKWDSTEWGEVIAEAAPGPRLAESAETLASTLEDLAAADRAGHWRRIESLLAAVGMGSFHSRGSGWRVVRGSPTSRDGLRFDHLPDDQTIVVRDTYRLLDDALHHGPWKQLYAAIEGAATIERGRMADPLTLQAQLLRDTVGDFVPEADDIMILGQLVKSHPQSMTCKAIRDALPRLGKRGTKTISARLKRMRKARVTRQPHGRKGGDVVTDKGLALVEAAGK